MAEQMAGLGDTETRLRSISHALGIIILAFAAGGLVLPFVAVPVLATFMTVTVTTPAGQEQFTPEALAILSALQFVAFIGVALAYVNWRGRWPFEVDLPELSDIGWMVGGFLSLLGASVALSIVLSVLGVQTAQNSVVTTGQSNPEFFLYMIPIAIFLVGPGEELVFRGVVQGLFRAAYGVVPAVLVTSALFGIAHYLALSGTGSGKLAYIAVAGVLGLVLGAVYEKTKNLLVPIVIHSAWNTMLFGVQWYVATHDVSMPATWIALP